MTQRLSKSKLFFLVAFLFAITAVLVPLKSAHAYTWTERLASGPHSWQAVASSADGMRIAGVSGYAPGDNKVSVSTDGGVTWHDYVVTGASKPWLIASDSTGMKLVVPDYSGYIYTSTDGGVTWTQRTGAGSHYWGDVASSADGTRLVAIDQLQGSGHLWTSSNSGATWTEHTAISSGLAVASDSTGLKLVVGVNAGTMYTSTDGGVTWVQRQGAGSHNWSSLASSSDGMKLVASTSYPDYGLYTSADGGVTWSVHNINPSSWWWRKSVASSSDGTHLAGTDGHYLWLSTDSGATWTQEAALGYHSWTSVASSSDGTHLAVAMGGGPNIWTNIAPIQNAVPTVTTQAASNISATAAALNGTNVSFGTPATLTDGGFEWGTTIAYGNTDHLVSAIGVYSHYITGSFACGTTYHYRAFGTNATGTGYGADMTFTTNACPNAAPTVATTAATSITITTASLNGNLVTVGAPASDTVGFQYGPTIAYGTTVNAPTPLTTPIPFGINVTGLTCNTTYHFRAKGTNATGTAYGSDMTFTTSACAQVSPTVATTAATGITGTGATLNGNLTALGNPASVTVGFNYGPTVAYGTTVTVTPAMVATGTFNKAITGLTCNTTYHYRAYGTNANGTANGADMTFTTSACPVAVPVVATTAAASVTTTGATLNGNLSTVGLPASTTVGFQYGTTIAYGMTATVMPAMTNTGTFNKAVTNLTCGTTYHFRAYATNATGTAYGADMTLTTGDCVVTYSCPAWTDRNVAGEASNWAGIASSSDGAKLVTAIYSNYVFTSTNSGTTWTSHPSLGTHNWRAVASDATGTNLVAVASNEFIHVSHDSGATWSVVGPGTGYWEAAASDASGTHLVVAANSGYIFTSADSGATWTPRTSAGFRNWNYLTSSADGTHLAAAVNGGYIYTSTDSGATWTARVSSGVRTWMAITSDSSGTRLAATAWSDHIYTSTNGGVTWTARADVKGWQHIASDATGLKLIAADDGYSYPQISIDGGATWTAQTTPGIGPWHAVSAASNGNAFSVTKHIGHIWTCGTVIVPVNPVLNANTANITATNTSLYTPTATANTPSYNTGTWQSYTTPTTTTTTTTTTTPTTTTTSTSTTSVAPATTAVPASSTSSTSSSTLHANTTTTSSSTTPAASTSTTPASSSSSSSTIRSSVSRSMLGANALGGFESATETTTEPTADVALTNTAVVATPPIHSFTRLLGRGSHGDDVTNLQYYLAGKGYLTATPSGYFGPLTEKAVAAFQSANGLDAVGLMGPKTLRLINSMIKGN